MLAISKEDLDKIEEARLALFEWFGRLPEEEQQYHRLAEFVDITQVLWRIAHIRREDVNNLSS